MQKRIKKALATCLAVALVLGMFPTNALEALAATVKSGYEILVSPTLVYEYIYQNVENHKLPVRVKSGKAGIIDINNNEIFPVKYDGAGLEANGELVTIRKDEKVGLYDADTKKEILPCKYVFIRVIDQNFILAYTSWSSISIYNSVGKLVTTAKYSEIYSINEELLMVYKNGKYGVMNVNGKMVYDCVYSNINYTDDGHKIMLQDNTGIWKLYDQNDSDNVVTLGKYTSVYDTGISIDAYTRVDDIEKHQQYTYDGETMGEPTFQNWNYQKLFKQVDEYEILYLYDDEANVLDVYNYSLEKIETFENVVFLFEDGMFEQYVYNYETSTIDLHCYYVFNGEEKITILDLDETYVRYNHMSSDDNVFIGYTSDTEWRAYVADGRVAIFTGDILNVTCLLDECLLVEYDDNNDDNADRYVLANYDGDEIESLAAANGAYYEMPSYSKQFFVGVLEGKKYLYGVGGKKICEIGAADDGIIDVTNSGGTHYYIENEAQNKTYMLDENQDYVATVDSFDYYYEYDDEYISISKNDNGTYVNEILEFDGTIRFSSKNYISSRLENNGKWIVQTRAGVWELYDEEFVKIATFGNAEYVSYDEELKVYKIFTYGNNEYLTKFGVYSAAGKAIIPTGSYKDSLYDYESNAWLLLNTKKQAIAFTAGGTKLCTIPDVKELGSFNDGYAVLKSTNDKYGIYKVTKLGHTHKTNSYNAKDATTSKNGYTSYKKCTICGDVTGKTTIYAASKISASSKNYNGKTQSVSLSVNDSKGKTISKSYYSVSGTTKAKKVGSYKVKITFKGKYTGSKTITWKINPTKTKFTKVSAGKKKITLKWSKKTTQVIGYKIQYSTDKNFKKGVKTVTIKKNKTTSKTISKLKSKKKYYVRICTYKGSYTSGWSSAKAVTVK